MSQKHIPAPWTHYSGSGDIYKDGFLIASVRLNSRDIEPEERATAQRIVQCVNALEGIRLTKLFYTLEGANSLSIELATVKSAKVSLKD